ncbi:hypothetical protein [Pseudofrankia sp. BMG5.36]|nr:hypothetical protein [Pseudofrankia sp. BMG5.36]
MALIEDPVSELAIGQGAGQLQRRDQKGVALSVCTHADRGS